MTQATLTGAMEMARTKRLLQELEPFVSRDQRMALRRGLAGEEASGFADIIDRIHHTISSMGEVYSQDGKGDQALVYLHYFAGGRASWYITEKDLPGRQIQAFGLADIYGDGGELGYISIEELIKNNVELDFYWEPKTLAEVRKERG